VPFRLTWIYPAGTKGKLDVANVAFAVVVEVRFAACTFIVPEGIVTLLRVRLPTDVVVPPRVIVALPRVAVLLAKKELGNVTATEVTLAFAKLPPV